MKNKIVLFHEGETVVGETFEEVFKIITEDGLIIEAVEDGVLHLKNKKGDKINANFYETVVPDKTIFETEIKDYRQKLRDSVSLLKSQGIDIPKENLKKLIEDFKFLPE